MILCDTNIFIEFYRGNKHILDVLRGIGPSSLALSVVTVGELYFGAKDRRELHKIQAHLSQIYQIPIDADISMLFIELLGKYALSHRLTVPDALIAATALCLDLPLYTLNIKDFHYLPHLNLYTPTG